MDIQWALRNRSAQYARFLYFLRFLYLLMVQLLARVAKTFVTILLIEHEPTLDRVHILKDTL